MQKTKENTRKLCLDVAGKQYKLRVSSNETFWGNWAVLYEFSKIINKDGTQQVQGARLIKDWLDCCKVGTDHWSLGGLETSWFREEAHRDSTFGDFLLLLSEDTATDGATCLRLLHFGIVCGASRERWMRGWVWNVYNLCYFTNQQLRQWDICLSGLSLWRFCLGCYNVHPVKVKLRTHSNVFICIGLIVLTPIFY